MNGALSGMRGVILGVGIGVLATKKAGPLAKKANSLVKGALLKYLASHATDQVTRRRASKLRADPDRHAKNRRPPRARRPAV